MSSETSGTMMRMLGKNQSRPFIMVVVKDSGEISLFLSLFSNSYFTFEILSCVVLSGGKLTL